jgi:hypothetical protein
MEVIFSDQSAVDLMVVHRMHIHPLATNLCLLLVDHFVQHCDLLVVCFVELHQCEFLGFQVSNNLVPLLLHARDVDIQFLNDFLLANHFH